MKEDEKLETLLGYKVLELPQHIDIGTIMRLTCVEPFPSVQGILDFVICTFIVCFAETGQGSDGEGEGLKEKEK